MDDAFRMSRIWPRKKFEEHSWREREKRSLPWRDQR